MHRFEGTRVVITGAGGGLGADIARRFSREGARVVVSDVNGEAASAVAAEVGGSACAADVSQRAQLRDLAVFTADTYGGIDVWVNNAGVHHLFQDSIEVPDDELDRMLDINLKPLLYSAKEVVPVMRAGGGGSFCNVASIGAVVIRPGAGPYAASKSGAISLTKSLALELAPEIRVNCVLPTSADTNLLRTMSGATEEWVAERYARNAGNLPMQRLCTGDDVAAAVAFLSSDDASFITGVALPVDGGRSAGGA